jgi:hypothetical protein
LLPELNDGEIALGGGCLMVVSILPLVVTFWFVFELIVESVVDSVTIGSARATPLMVKSATHTIKNFFISITLSFMIKLITTIYTNKKGETPNVSP